MIVTVQNGDYTDTRGGCETYFFRYCFGEYSSEFGWLVVLGLTALWDNISVYIGPSPKEREKAEKG